MDEAATACFQIIGFIPLSNTVEFRGGMQLGDTQVALSGRNGHRHFRSFPSGEAARELNQIGDPVLMEQARSDRGAIAARAMNRDATISRDLRDPLLQMIQRNVDATFNMFG